MGRAGRDEKISHAIMLYSKGLKRHVDESMVKYCTNQDKCRRHTLMILMISNQQVVDVYVVISVVLVVTVAIATFRKLTL